MLRESAERERAEIERARFEREESTNAARTAAEHAAAIVAARRDLDRTIEGMRVARRARSGVEAADAAWRVAKAGLIELETGEPPPWAQAEGETLREDDPRH